ncbi:MAG: bifunctional phosphoribosyl-AMP cyclohydrolase/phosphoribosyl-ATP diphosphatase HisIE [Methanomassiliicoccales archaeon]
MISKLKFDENGLIPVIVQDAETNEVLMMAYANEEACKRMFETGKTHFYSRSRKKLWMKGETSGNVQDIVSIQLDCDSDTLLVRVRQTGNACHLNRPSCFEEVLYGDLSETASIIPELRRVIHDRKMNPKEGSYTCKLLEDENKLFKKVVEEAAELIIAAKGGDRSQEAWETADLIYHLMVLLEKIELPIGDVYKILSERRK